MNDVIRKRSPRAPSIALPAAIDKVLKIYEAEGRHHAPADAVAQDIGYKSSASGAAKTTLASIGYYGLLERPKDAFFAVSKSVEEFKFAPNTSMQREILERWLRSPEVFAELLESYPTNLPSQATLKFDLIKRGFSAAAADDCLACFIESFNYVRGFNLAGVSSNPEVDEEQTPPEIDEVEESQKGLNQTGSKPADIPTTSNDYDQIPVRLSKGRKAWLVIPNVFFEADKKRLITQIEVLLTEDEDQ